MSKNKKPYLFYLLGIGYLVVLVVTLYSGELFSKDKDKLAYPNFGNYSSYTTNLFPSQKINTTYFKNIWSSSIKINSRNTDNEVILFENLNNKYSYTPSRQINTGVISHGIGFPNLNEYISQKNANTNSINNINNLNASLNLNYDSKIFQGLMAFNLNRKEELPRENKAQSVDLFQYEPLAEAGNGSTTYQGIGIAPGGDPTTEPIPVDDSWGLLSILILLYTGRKWYLERIEVKI